MSKTEFEYLDLIVFSNCENRTTMLAVMKIAFEAAISEVGMVMTRAEKTDAFNKWIADIKLKLDK